MKLFIVIILIISAGVNTQSLWMTPAHAEYASDQRIKEAYDKHQSDLQVGGEGTVIRILADDLSGSRHQRFIIQLASGQTLLIAHNIDIAPKINALKVGDRIQFYGEYEWNQKGGVIHWTHHDPNNRHQAGWLKHRGVTYQ